MRKYLPWLLCLLICLIYPVSAWGSEPQPVCLRVPTKTPGSAVHPTYRSFANAPLDGRVNAAGATLTFEGFGDNEPVMDFYRAGYGGFGNGPGPNYGIYFSPNALAIIDSDDGGSGNFGGEPSPSTVLYFLEGSAATLNVPAGFKNGFSFYYSTPYEPGYIKVYDGLDCTGNILATLTLPETPDTAAPDPNGAYSPLVPYGVAFSGIARSVDFGGTANRVCFDNITLGSSVPIGYSGKLLFYIDKNNSGGYDSGEEVANESVYLRNRSNPLATKTASDGTITIPDVRIGDQIFVRYLAYSQPAVKSSRGSAGSMFDLYMDTDSVGGTGELEPRTITAAEAQTLAQNETVYIALNHPIISWNLVVALNWNADEQYVTKLKAGFASASNYLFDCTDGQMKLGRIDIRNNTGQSSDLWKRAADIRVHAGDQWPQSVVGAVSMNQTDCLLYLPRYFSGSATASGDPNTSNYYTTIIHECGHYLLSFFDEYLDGNKNKIHNAWRGVWNHAEVPDNYGLMDYQYTSSEMSSSNDYLASYDGRPAGDMTNQIWQHYCSTGGEHRPCWQYLYDRFDNSNGSQTNWNGYNGIQVSLSMPPAGVYQLAGHLWWSEEKPTSQDRPGPAAAKLPYAACEFPTAQPSEARRAGAASQYRDISVSVVDSQGAPIPRARVWIENAAGERVEQGSTSNSGELLCSGVLPSDLVCVSTDGQIRRVVAGTEGKLVVAMGPLPQSGVKTVRQIQQAAAGPGMILDAAVSPSAGGYSLTIRVNTSEALQAMPAVTLRPSFGSPVSPVVSQVSPGVYQCSLELPEVCEGSIDVSGVGQSGTTEVSSVFAVRELAGDDARIWGPEGRLEARLASAIQTSGMLAVSVGSADSIITPSDPSLRLIGEPTAFHLQTGADPATAFVVDMRLYPEWLLGVDSSTIALYRYVPATGWSLVPSVYAAGDSTVSATNVADGIYAAFAAATSDTTPPSSIADLTATTGANGWSADLKWTAPGDDGNTGRATAYRVSFSTLPITAESLPNCAQLGQLLAPAEPGTTEYCSLQMPDPGTHYYFCVQAADEAGNVGPLSNIAQAVSYAADTDGDGLPDQWEIAYGLDPQQGGDGALDPDDDGLTNADEYLHGTIPTVADTDSDGFADGMEVVAQTDPKDAASPQSVTPGEAKLLPADQKVGIVHLVATAAFNSGTYAQTEQGVGGILLEGISVPYETALAVIGTVGLSADGDRCVKNCTYRADWMTTAVPVAMPNTAIGGGALGYQGGVLGGKGLNNIGLFIKTWGKITYVDPSGAFLYVSDGSNLSDGNTLGEAGGAIQGIRIVCPADTMLPSVGRVVSVDGISCRCDVGGQKVRAVRIRSRADIKDSSNTVSITGLVKLQDGSPIADVLVQSDDTAYSAHTDASGRYDLRVPNRWSGTVIPSKGAFSFDPQDRSYAYLVEDTSSQDYIGTPMFVISGYVKTPAGAPVEYAQVSTDGVSSSDYTYTNADGYYSLTVPYGWSGIVVAERYQYTIAPPSISYTNVTADIADQNFTATPYPAISGYVTTGEGAPIQGVRLYAEGEDFYDSTYTDSEGYYSLSVPPGWTGMFTAQADIYTFEPTARPYEGVTGDLTDQNYLATPYPTISGYVRTATGAPVEGVELYTDDYWGGSAYTDYDGHYVLYVPPAWSGTVETSAQLWTTDPETRSYEDVNANIDEQNYLAIPDLYISGYVKTAAGDPLPDVMVQDDSGDIQGWTDEQGYYRVDVPAGWSGILTASRELYTMTPPSMSYTNVTADVTDQNYTATPYPVISGYVKTPEGAPVEYVSMCYLSNWWRSVYTDANGYYSISVPPGYTNLVTASRDYYTITPPSMSYTNVTADIPDQNYTATPYPAISGYVRTADGAPVPNVDIYTEGNWYNSTFTDPYGYYRLIIPLGWSGTVQTSADLWSTDPATRTYENITGNLDEQNYIAKPDVFVSGHVKTASGDPIEGAEVRDASGEIRCWTDAQGYYIVDVPMGWSGTLTATAYLYSMDPASRSYTDVTADVTNQDYTAIHYPVISGYVKTPSGAPVQYAQLNTEGEWWQTAYTNSDGSYSLTVPPGWSGNVYAEASQYTLTPPSMAYTNVAADITDQNYTAVAYPIISGCVKTADGAPVQNVQIYADGAYVYTDATGAYTLAVPYGWSGAIRPWSSDWSTDPYERVYDNVVSDLTGQDFTAVPHAIISGHIKTSSGDPVPEVEVYGGGGYGLTDQNGYYSIEIHKGWTGWISVYKEAYTMDPPYRSYETVTTDIPDQDYVATPPVIISGCLRLPDGSPLPNTEVYAEGDTYWDYTGTDSEGRYSLAVPSGWSGTVAPWVWPWPINPESRVYNEITTDQPNQDFIVTPYRTISGYVKTTSGAPLADVEIHDDAFDISVRTDQQGYYYLLIPMGWSGTLSASLDTSYYTMDPSTRTYSGVMTDLADQNYTAMPYPTISGYVRTATGAPVANVEMYTDDGGWWTYTDTTGFYTLSVPPGWSGNILTWARLWSTNPASKSYTNVIVDAVEQNYAASPNRTISGYVKTADGTPVAGIELYTDGMWWSYAYTGSDGYYSIPVPSNWSGFVYTRSEHWTTTPASKKYTNVAADVTNQDYTAVANPIISGYVMTADSNPIAYADVYDDSYSIYTQTDENGYYSVQVSKGWSGNINVSAEVWGYAIDPRQRSYTDVQADIPDQNYTAVPPAPPPYPLIK